MDDIAAAWPADTAIRCPVSALRASSSNSRTHTDTQVRQIAASIREWGFTIPLLVDEERVVIAGHARLAAAKLLGLDEVPVVVARGWSDSQKRAYLIADNKLAENAGWDSGLLAAELTDLAAIGMDLGLLGFQPLELKSLLPPVDSSGGGPTADDKDADRPEDIVPDIPPPVTRVGDVWLLGRHRLACGSSGDFDLVARLVGDTQPTLLFTSPPYGQQRKYTGESTLSWDEMVHVVFGACLRSLAPDAQVLVNLGLVHRDGEWQPYWQGWIEWMRQEGWRRFGWYVWDQGPGLPGDWNGRLGPSFEFVFHFNRESRQANKIIPCRWAGHVNSEKGGLRERDGKVGEWTHAGHGVQDMRVPDNVLRITRHKARGMETEHPAVFPVALPELIMRTYSQPGEAVLEPFSGSGTSLIAAEATGRVSLSIDLAPSYVDLAIARWFLLHPDQPVVLAETGQTYEDVASARATRVMPPSRRRRHKNASI